MTTASRYRQGTPGDGLPRAGTDHAVALSRSRVARTQERVQEVSRLISAASGLAATIAVTEALTHERADIVSGRAAQQQLINRRAGREIVSLSEAARRTGRHPEVLRRWCIEGRIPAVRIGRTWGLTAETVATLVQHANRSRPRLPVPEPI